MRKRRLEQVSDNSTPDDCQISNTDPVLLETELEMVSNVKSTADRQIIKHETLGNRTSIELVHLFIFITVKICFPFLTFTLLNLPQGSNFVD